LSDQCKKLNIAFYSYDDANSFNGSVKNRSLDVTTSSGSTTDNKKQGSMRDLAEIVAYLTYRDDELKNKILGELSRQIPDTYEQVKERINKTQNEKLSYYLRAGDERSITDLSNSINATLHNNMKTTNNVIRYAIREFGLDMKKNKTNSLKDYLNYKVWKGMKTQNQYNVEFNENVLNFIDETYKTEFNRIKEYRYSGDVNGEYYENLLDYQPIINLLNNKILQLKKFNSNYILSNNDMYHYIYGIGSNYSNEELKLKDGQDPEFNNVLKNVDGDIDVYTLTSILQNVTYDVGNYTYEEAKRIQNEYNEQFRSN
jgi:hypothetical protein